MNRKVHPKEQIKESIIFKEILMQISTVWAVIWEILMYLIMETINQIIIKEVYWVKYGWTVIITVNLMIYSTHYLFSKSKKVIKAKQILEKSKSSKEEAKELTETKFTMKNIPQWILEVQI